MDILHNETNIKLYVNYTSILNKEFSWMYSFHIY